jgi:hypothetical protein
MLEAADALARAGQKKVRVRYAYDQFGMYPHSFRISAHEIAPYGTLRPLATRVKPPAE